MRVLMVVLIVQQFATRHTTTVSAFSTPSSNLSQFSSTSSGIGSGAINNKESSTLTFQYTHLEVNGMLWQIPEANLSLVVDPIASELNFGIPWGYRANKVLLNEADTFDLIVEAAPTHCLLSQGLDDHTHLPTLAKLVEKMPNLKFIVAPSAKNKISKVVGSSRITVMEPGQSLSLSSSVTLKATQGALVGPPWQARENGWLVNVNESKSIYMEPHADVTDQAIEGLRADIVISPVKQQSLPAQVPQSAQFTLVYGGERTLQIAQALQASVIIPLGNGELKTEGPLANLVEATGSFEEFEQLVENMNARTVTNAPIRVERPMPGVPLSVQL